ncbi:MAG: hypothetical protein IJA34_07500 [Lachnospiraceae bacterium]|nr:hypothetical protein [Lachnospiraceae bacterium]
MTDREILELLLKKTTTIEDDVTGLKCQVGEMKDEINELKCETKEMKDEINGLKCETKEIKGQIIELKRMDFLILDEVERVHELLNKHKEDRTVHTA